MSQLEDWIQAQSRRRLVDVQHRALREIGQPGSAGQRGQIDPTLFPAFVLQLIAEQQARIDALEVQAQAFSETTH